MPRLSISLGSATVLLTVLLAGCAIQPRPVIATRDAATPPPIRHVFLIVLENEPFDVAFGSKSPAPYLAHELTKQGALLTKYYATGHYSLDNYISLISGQAPNHATQHDCHLYS